MEIKTGNGITPKKHKGKIMTIGKKFIEKGVEQGVEQGIEQGVEQGIEQGIEQGVEQGIEQRTEFIIGNMLKKKLGVSEISSMTDLPIAEIEKIKKKLNFLTVN